MNLRDLTLTPEEAEIIHNYSLWAFGGAKGLRDAGAFESAVLRAQMGYYDSSVGECAALLESLLMNHPFVDGNKRTAWFSFATYLTLKKRYIKAKIDQQEIYRWLISTISHKPPKSFPESRFNMLVGWITINTGPMKCVAGVSRRDSNCCKEIQEQS